MKLVVSYQTGDGYTYSEQCVVPVEYESAEQLAIDIEDAVTRYLFSLETYRQAVDKFTLDNGSFIDHHGPERETWYKKWKEFYDIHNTSPAITFSVASLHIDHFVEDYKYVPPTIYTVDEWFDSVKVN